MQKTEATKSTTTAPKKREQEQAFFAPALPARCAVDATASNSGNTSNRAFSASNTKPIVQAKLKINAPNDQYEQEADDMAERVMRMPEKTTDRPPLPLSNTIKTIQRNEKAHAAEPTTDAEKTEKPAAGVGFGSPKWPWWAMRDIFGGFSGRWSSAYKKPGYSGYPLLSLDVSPELAAAQWMALQNLMWAGVFSGNSPYPGMDFSKGLEIAENLSGGKDTYLSLASMPFRFDLGKYLKGDFADMAKANLGWALLYGIPLQGGLVGLNAAMDSKLDFASLINPATSSFSTAPAGMSRPFNYKNIPDPRWSSYLFHQIPGALKAEIDDYQTEKPNKLSLGLGLNVGSFLSDNYPKEADDQKSYRGLELYPFGSYQHQWAAEGDTPATLTHAWMAGLYGGHGGYGGLLSAGQQFGDKREDYYRAMFSMNRFDWLSLLQAGGELSSRYGNGGLRGRLEAAAKFNILDKPNWELSAGATLRGLLPGAGQPGAIEAGGDLSLYYRHQVAGQKTPLRTGLSFGMMDRLADPFDANSARLQSLTGGISIMDILRFNIESHRVRGGTSDPSMNLPDSDLRFMLFIGSGGFRANPAAAGAPDIQRKCNTCQDEDKSLQTKMMMRKSTSGRYTTSPQFAAQLKNSSGHGSPLPDQTLSSMSQAFGADFSSVRIHTNNQAAEMNRGIQAKAFTYGSNIYFNQGQYSPESAGGKRLLAHELTHVVQQGGQKGAIQRFSDVDHHVISEAALQGVFSEKDLAATEKGNKQRDFSQNKWLGPLLLCEKSNFGGYAEHEHFDHFIFDKQKDRWVQEEEFDKIWDERTGKWTQRQMPPRKLGKPRKTPLQYIETELMAAVEKSMPDSGAFVHVGNAFHTIEDFFAHSNFVALTQGEDDFEGVLRTHSGHARGPSSETSILSTVSSRPSSTYFDDKFRKERATASPASHGRMASDFHSNPHHNTAMTLAALVIREVGMQLKSAFALKTKSARKAYIQKTILPKLKGYFRPPSKKDKWWEKLLRADNGVMRRKIRTLQQKTPVTVNHCMLSPLKGVEGTRNAPARTMGWLNAHNLSPAVVNLLLGARTDWKSITFRSIPSVTLQLRNKAHLTVGGLTLMPFDQDSSNLLNAPETERSKKEQPQSVLGASYNFEF